MLMTEWNLDYAKGVWYEEGLEQGLIFTAQNALANGIPVDMVQKITGLDIDKIRGLAL